MSSIDWDAIKAEAQKAKDNAYAPYSGFSVGAALGANGKIFSGCNVENSSYPVGICAERAALAAAIAAGCSDFEALVIVAEKPIVPCGMCRQALSEFNTSLPILMVSDQLEAQATLSQLFPEAFSLKD